MDIQVEVDPSSAYSLCDSARWWYGPMTADTVVAASSGTGFVVTSVPPRLTKARISLRSRATANWLGGTMHTFTCLKSHSSASDIPPGPSMGETALAPSENSQRKAKSVRGPNDSGSHSSRRGSPNET